MHILKAVACLFFAALKLGLLEPVAVLLSLVCVLDSQQLVALHVSQSIRTGT